MPRPLPTIAPPAWEPPRPETLRIPIQIQTITPLFGGGIEPRTVDLEVPVRAPAVRGHLRFWWRATCAHLYESAADLHDAEATLWGSASRPGQVAVRVKDVSAGRSVSHDKLAGRPHPRQGPELGYFLFPFQEQKEGPPAATGHAEVRFVLEVEGAMADSPEVARAIRAWLLCGGLGARTRRGCGALAATEAPWSIPADAALPEWLGLPGGERRSELPVAPSLAGGTLILGPRKTSPEEAWRELARFWAAFRKGHVGSIPYQPMSGGRWSDQQALAEAVRGGFSEEVALGKPVLGLPIVYQRLRGARFSGTVEGGESGRRRRSSPVILRPIRLADGSARPLIALLWAPDPGTVRVDEWKFRLRVSRDDPVLRELGCDHPLEAVARAAQERWGQEGRVYRLEARR